MALTDMTLTKDEAKEEAGLEQDLPRYPYGLCICLDDETMKKLGMTDLPPIGAEMMLTARVRVKSVQAYECQTDDGAEKEQHADLQITAMEVVPAQAARSMAERMYGE